MLKISWLNQSKDDLNVEKPIVLYYAKYIGVLSSNKSYPLEEGAYVNVYEDRIVVELLKSKFKTTIPYKNMTDIQNVDAGKKVDMDRVFGLSLVSLGIGSIVGLLWKRHAILTVLKYSDDDSKHQTITLDFMGNTEYAQPLIDKKMCEVQPPLPTSHEDKTTMSIADELSKLAKLKEQGVITEEEFSELKRNLMNKM